MTAMQRPTESITSVDIYFVISSDKEFRRLRRFFLRVLLLDIGEHWADQNRLLNVFVTKQGLEVVKDYSADSHGPLFVLDKTTVGLTGIYAWSNYNMSGDLETDISKICHMARVTSDTRNTYLVKVTDEGFNVRLLA